MDGTSCAAVNLEVIDSSSACEAEYQKLLSVSLSVTQIDSSYTSRGCFYTTTSLKLNLHPSSTEDYRSDARGICLRAQVANCSQINFDGANSGACNCGSTTCDESSGLWCNKTTSTCAHHAQCVERDGSVANAEACSCVATTCAEASGSGLYCWANFPTGKCTPTPCVNSTGQSENPTLPCGCGTSICTAATGT
jgi:hypothetical protein